MSSVKPILIVRMSSEHTPQEAAALGDVLNEQAGREGYCVMLCATSGLRRNEFKFSTLTPDVKMTAAQLKKLKALLSSKTLPGEKQEKGEKVL